MLFLGIEDVDLFRHSDSRTTKVIMSPAKQIHFTNVIGVSDHKIWSQYNRQMYRSVPQIRPTPPFATLALVQSTGGAYTRDATFSLANTPSLDREMFSDSLDAGFVLVLPFHHGDDLEPDCIGLLCSCPL